LLFLQSGNQFRRARERDRKTSALAANGERKKMFGELRARERKQDDRNISSKSDEHPIRISFSAAVVEIGKACIFFDKWRLEK